MPLMVEEKRDCRSLPEPYSEALPGALRLLLLRMIRSLIDANGLLEPSPRSRDPEFRILTVIK